MGVRFLIAAAAMLAATAGTAEPRDFHCTCRAGDGSKHELGQTVCIRVGGKPYLARCETSLNVTTWHKIQDGCPEASLSAWPQLLR